MIVFRDQYCNSKQRIIYIGDMVYVIYVSYVYMHPMYLLLTYIIFIYLLILYFKLTII